MDDLRVPLALYGNNGIYGINDYINISDDQVRIMREYDENTTHSFRMIFDKMNSTVKTIRYSLYCHKSLHHLYLEHEP